MPQKVRTLEDPVALDVKLRVAPEFSDTLGKGPTLSHMIIAFAPESEKRMPQISRFVEQFQFRFGNRRMNYRGTSGARSSCLIASTVTRLSIP